MRAKEFLIEYRDNDDDQTAHRDGLDLESIQVGSDFQVTASCHDRQLARVIFKKSGDTLVPRDLSVEERYRGQGIAAVMYDWVKDLGYKIQRSPDQSQAGQAFWDKNRGEEGRVWEATDLEDRFKKYIKPTVKTTPKIERITNPAGRTTDHVEYKVTGPTGMVHRFKSKKEAEAHYSSFTEQEMWEDNDTAISLSKLGKFHPGADTLAEFVPERATAQYALHPDKWESTFYSLTNKDSDKLKYYGPKKISIPPGTLVGDMAIANKFYRAKTTEEKQQYAEAYKASLQPYPVDVSKYRMPELLIPKQGVVENFADGKGPGRPGDSQRHGIPKGATMAELERASHAKGRKGQLARWQLNMRRGHKK
jgi:GNAT superfamily N-acetyltransferase